MGILVIEIDVPIMEKDFSIIEPEAAIMETYVSIMEVDISRMEINAWIIKIEIWKFRSHDGYYYYQNSCYKTKVTDISTIQTEILITKIGC